VYQRDWLDELSWRAIVPGVAGAILAQIVLTLVVFRPLNLELDWSAVLMVELSIGAGAFLSGWLAWRSPIINGLITALLSAAIALMLTAASTPTAISLLNVMFLFGTFSAMGVLGGLLASRLRTRRMAR